MTGAVTYRNMLPEATALASQARTNRVATTPTVTLSLDTEGL